MAFKHFFNFTPPVLTSFLINGIVHANGMKYFYGDVFEIPDHTVLDTDRFDWHAGFCAILLYTGAESLISIPGMWCH
jgi:hypothetical protein